jgi:hypothetical protein
VSLSVAQAIAWLSTPGCKFSGADQKYGWPHKFYMTSPTGEPGKLRSESLASATPDELVRFAALSRTIFGVDWYRDPVKGLGYAQPQTSSFYGWQTFGTIGPDGEPVFDEVSPKAPGPEFWKGAA